MIMQANILVLSNINTEYVEGLGGVYQTFWVYYRRHFELEMSN